MSAYRTVVVGTDGSDSSLRAVEKAGSIAGADAKLIVATAYLPQHEDARAADTLKEESYKSRAVPRSTRSCARLRTVPQPPEPRTSKRGRSSAPPSTRLSDSPKRSAPTCLSSATSG